MRFATPLRQGIQEIGFALRRPEDFAIRWRDRAEGSAAPPAIVFPVLLLNAALGLGAYGLTLGFHAGWREMLWRAFLTPLACGLGWLIALPALYIFNTASGSKLDLSTTLLAAATTVSFGALAMLASIPIHWFFSLALPYAWVRLAVNVVIFAGVGACMADVFLRSMAALEPNRAPAYPAVWLGLVGALGFELMSLFNVFQF
jgi:hypothetical protein